MELVDHEIHFEPFMYTQSLIGGKWKMPILFWLYKDKVMRYGQLRRALGTITHKMLSNQLKELEADGLIVRREYPQVPPKVEYSLSEKGLSLIPILCAQCLWGSQHMNDANGGAARTE